MKVAIAKAILTLIMLIGILIICCTFNFAAYHHGTCIKCGGRLDIGSTLFPLPHYTYTCEDCNFVCKSVVPLHMITKGSFNAVL